MESQSVRLHAVLGQPGEGRAFGRQAVIFVLVGLALYALVYAAAERVVYEYARRNRFFVIGSVRPASFDAVILGASHAAALDYQDMSDRLEDMAGIRVMNLAVVGGGVTVNRLHLDYFLARHTTASVLYVVDSFAFYDRQWNEGRLSDTSLLSRAPLDFELARLLVQQPDTRWLALDYLSGFSKINNPDRFEPDVFSDETTRFNRAYRPVAQIDRQRIAYLYPDEIDDRVFRRYLAEFEALVDEVQSRGIRFVAVKAPIPERIRGMLPREQQFDIALKAVLDGRGAAFHDFSRSSNEDALFYDTDHLNRSGVIQFFEQELVPLLRGFR